MPECSNESTPGQASPQQEQGELYQPSQKVCKGTCGEAYPRTAEYFQRCKKYKSDGLDTWCKTCSRQRRQERAARSGRSVEHAPRYYTDDRGAIRCCRCHGRVYDSGIDGEWYCLDCGTYVNPPPVPLRYAVRMTGGIVEP